jgi:hypothetical protein
VSDVFEAVGAFGWGEAVEEGAEAPLGVVDGARACDDRLDARGRRSMAVRR